MAERDMFVDRKGHRLDAAKLKKYCEDPDIRATADFIRGMNPRLKSKRRLRLDPGTIAYAAILLVMVYLLFMEFSVPQKTTIEVSRTIAEVPVINTGVNMTAGEVSADGDADLGLWWNISLSTSCKGAERFYTNMTFMVDWNAMMERYNKVYCDPGKEPMQMLPPEAMFENVTNYDCEDFAHATRCLAGYYNVTCSFWVKESIGPVIPVSEGHLGVCCKVDGEWKCV